MTLEKIMCLVLLAVLMLGCFLSENFAGLFVRENEEKKQKVSLIIKLGTLIITVIAFIIIFAAA